MGTLAEYKDCIDVEFGVVDCVWFTGRDADSVILIRVDVQAPRLHDNR